MRVIIIGCGRVGMQLASLLSMGGHDVVIVDRDMRAFEKLGPNFRGQKIVGVGFDREVLKQAQIEQSDALVAMTSSDNTNIVVSLIARREFRVPKIVTRVHEPERAEIYRRFGIPTISATTWAANEVLKMIAHRDLASRLTLGNGEVEILQIDLPPHLAEHSISELTVSGEIMISTIVRQGKALIPFSGSKLHAGDVVYLAVLSSSMEKLKKLLGMM
ncbi:potassium channel family protein [Desulfopila aestuarii]|uniref:Trk system potassium uptake protein TrkA n=1 Tax=Desulfopila aestuarii DSM 18488 TaxID=1121416 RepID=A0A1M7YJF1_9BACT|nr:TrkA family potassium uptake protein [Desulfopila aestuarii]SHO52747.1 trk system potassium uptake protein TrkA [Desulfopila aestuarii DSM 18488]